MNDEFDMYEDSYDDAYEAVEASFSSFELSQENVKGVFDAVIDRLQDLGLNEAEITRKFQEALA